MEENSSELTVTVSEHLVNCKTTQNNFSWIYPKFCLVFTMYDIRLENA